MQDARGIGVFYFLVTWALVDVAANWSNDASHFTTPSIDFSEHRATFGLLSYMASPA